MSSNGNGRVLKRSPFKMLHDFVLVQMDPMEKETQGGIILPEDAQRFPRQGTAISVGPGFRDADNDYPGLLVHVGDRVLVNYQQGQFVNDDKSLRIFKESQILARVVDPMHSEDDDEEDD